MAANPTLHFPLQSTLTGQWLMQPEGIFASIRKVVAARIKPVAASGITLDEGDILVIEITASDRVPEVQAVVEKLNEMGALNANWDSYGALRPSASSILGALQVLSPVAVARRPLPAMAISAV